MLILSCPQRKSSIVRLQKGCVLLGTALGIMGCLGGSNSGSTPTPTQAANTAYVDFGSSVQTIRGFGGSTAWISNLTAGQADILFGKSNIQEMGYSLLRVRIDPGGSANWGVELNNAQLASARGASVFAPPWTPPASMKSNNNTVGGTLNPSSYGEIGRAH